MNADPAVRHQLAKIGELILVQDHRFETQGLERFHFRQGLDVLDRQALQRETHKLIQPHQVRDCRIVKWRAEVDLIVRTGLVGVLVHVCSQFPELLRLEPR